MFIHAHSVGCNIHLEHPPHANSWAQKCLQFVPGKYAPLHQCRFGARHFSNGFPVKKLTKILTTCQEVHRLLDNKCKGGHIHGQFVGDGPTTSMSERYPKKMCQKLAELFCQKNKAPLCSSKQSKAQGKDQQRGTEASAFPGIHVEMPTPAAFPKSKAEVSDQQLKDIQVGIKRVHVNNWHPGTLELLKTFKDAGYQDWALEEVRQFACGACQQTRKPDRMSRPARILIPSRFNEAIQVDICELKDPQDNIKHSIINMVDRATGFHVAASNRRKNAPTWWSKIFKHWIRIFGRPERLEIHPQGEGFNDYVGLREQELGIIIELCPTEAHWSIGRVEVSQKVLKSQLYRTIQAAIGDGHSLADRLAMCLNTKNTLASHRGFSPYQWVLGVCAQAIGNLPDGNGIFSGPDPNAQFNKTMRLREEARVAFVKAESALRIRYLARAQGRPLLDIRPRMLCYYWRKTLPVKRIREAEPFKDGGFRGPARIICLEHRHEEGKQATVVWLTHQGRFFRCCPRQLRPATWPEIELHRAMGRGGDFGEPDAVTNLEDILRKDGNNRWRDFTGREHQIPNRGKEPMEAQDTREDLDMPMADSFAEENEGWFDTQMNTDRVEIESEETEHGGIEEQEDPLYSPTSPRDTPASSSFDQPDQTLELEPSPSPISATAPGESVEAITIPREREGRTQINRVARRELLRRAQLSSQREAERSRSRSHFPPEREEDVSTAKSSESAQHGQRQLPKMVIMTMICM